MSETECRKFLLSKVQDPQAKRAFEDLETGLRATGIPVCYECKNAIKAVTFREGKWYPFSFIPTAVDLLFYIRKPALNLQNGMHAMALRHDPQSVNVSQTGVPSANAAGETKIRIRTAAEARTLLSWLVPLVPEMRRNARK